MESHFRLESRSDGDKALLIVGGELDLAASPALDVELTKTLTSDASLVVVDLRDLEFIDSTGLSVLVRAHKQAEHSGKRFALVNGSHQVRRLLDLTGVAKQMPLVEDPGELLEGG
jgi:anti-anti-sigma factor